MPVSPVPERIRVIDSHTGGEPTRVVIAGGPELSSVAPSKRCAWLRRDFDHFRSAIVNEPRGADAMVGAFLCEPHDPRCTAGVVFFNNVGYLGMCVHGTIGVITTLAHLRQIDVGTHLLETPVGIVSAVLYEDGQVSVRNVPSYRCEANLCVQVVDYGPVRGHVAWGGNWFFLVDRHDEDITLANTQRLTDLGWRIRVALKRQGVVAPDGAEVDHIELFGPPSNARADSRNFVLCPGRVYDRSPCGTGTSAKIACLIADGQLRPGGIWRQEGIVGSIFEATGRIEGPQVVCIVKGSAHITAEATLICGEADPFRTGIRA